MRPLSSTSSDGDKARPNKAAPGSATAIDASIGWHGWNNTRPLRPRLLSMREDAAAMVDTSPKIDHTKARAKPAGHNSPAAPCGGKIWRMK